MSRAEEDSRRFRYVGLPELMAELDASKRDRVGSLMLCRDCGEREPWPKPDQPDFTHMGRKVKDVIRAAGLRHELSFTSFDGLASA